MECIEVRKQYPNIKFEYCCESCHEDSDMGFGEDLWFYDLNGKLRNVCCAISRGLESMEKLREENK